jgi:hypothetical protein
MTSTDVEAAHRPQAAGTEAKRTGSSRAARRLMILPVAVLLVIALATTSFAATSTQPLNGYGGQTTPKPGSGTSPSKSTKTPTSKTPAATTPANEPAPATSSSVPTTTTTPTKVGSLPFTGFNLSWTVGGGLLLVAMGFSIVVVQRRQGRDSGR